MADVKQNNIKVNERVRVAGLEHLGVGEVLRICESGGVYQADVVFDHPDGRTLETVPLERLERAPYIFERLASGDVDSLQDFLLKQLAYQLPLANAGGELSNSRTDLLPHQILLTRDIVESEWRKYLIADEVGLGKTIETGLIAPAAVRLRVQDVHAGVVAALLVQTAGPAAALALAAHADLPWIAHRATSPAVQGIARGVGAGGAAAGLAAPTGVAIVGAEATRTCGADLVLQQEVEPDLLLEGERGGRRSGAGRGSRVRLRHGQ